MVLCGEFDGTLIAEGRRIRRIPKGGTTLRKADFDFNGDFAVTFRGEDVADVCVDTAEPFENEWRGRASRMQFGEDYQRLSATESA